MLRGWCAYFRHGACSRTFSYLDHYAFRRVVCWLRHKHPNATWALLRRCHLLGWQPTGARLTLYRPRQVRIVRYRYRGNTIASPWTSEIVT